MNKNIFCSGYLGFLGKSIVRQLQEKKYSVIIPEKRLDLTNSVSEILEFLSSNNIDQVIHSANLVGGIAFNNDNQGDIFYENSLMNLKIIHASYLNDVVKFVGIGSVCEYDDECEIPFKEQDVLKGIPTESNRAYGISKRNMYEQTLAYKKQFGFNGIHPLLINLFGENDCYSDDRSHVIAALIKKFHHAKINNQNSVTLFGDGTPTRSFLYVEDAASAIIFLMENYDSIDPINVGMDFTISIKDLAEMISKIIGFEGEIVWDTSKPNGQMKRQLDVSKLYNLGWTPKFSFENALEKTINHYMRTYAK